MAAESSALDVGTGDDEIAYLQHSLLPVLASAVAFLGWAWLVYVLVREQVFGNQVVPTVALVLSAYLSYQLRRAHYTPAC